MIHPTKLDGVNVIVMTPKEYAEFERKYPPNPGWLFYPRGGDSPGDPVCQCGHNRSEHAKGRFCTGLHPKTWKKCQ